MIYLSLFIFIVSLISLFRKKHTRKQNEVEEQFWEREIKANNTRRQDISRLPYITIPLEKFPIGIYENEELRRYESALKRLSGQQILNLGTQTNTDVKLKYGPANLNYLVDCDQRFSTLCHTLISYAGCLQKLGYVSEAQTVLEFGISCGSDLSKNYLLLADIYKEQGYTAKLNSLLEHARELDSMMKDSILTHLEALIAK